LEVNQGDEDMAITGIFGLLAVWSLTCGQLAIWLNALDAVAKASAFME
jgi:hypothetical protein